MKVIVKSYPEDTPYITLYPISDVHIGDPFCMEKEFDRYLAKIAADPYAAVICCGDWLNNATKNSKSNIYEEKYSPQQQKRIVKEKMAAIKDKIVAVVEGNHCYRTNKEVGIDNMEDICDSLGILDVYAGDAAFVKISLGEKRNRKPATYMIYATHGDGGGSSQLGTGISRQDNFHMAIEGVDISVSGHTHRPSKTPSARLVFDPHNNKVTRRNTLIFVCTAWLDYGGYAVRKQYKPTAFYPDTIWLSGSEKEWR